MARCPAASLAQSPGRYLRSTHSRSSRVQTRKAAALERNRGALRKSQEHARRKPPVLLLSCPLVDPVVHRFVPKTRILRLQHPVAFIGEVQHPGRHAVHLQGCEKLKALAYVQSVILLPVDDQRGRSEVLRVLVRRPLLVQFTIVVGSAFELPVVEPEFFGRSPGRLGVEHAVMRYQALEAVSMA